MMQKRPPIRTLVSIALLVIFLFQIAYLMYRLHAVLILGIPIPNDVKLSASVAGLCLGVMFLLKGYQNRLIKDDRDRSETDSEEED